MSNSRNIRSEEAQQILGKLPSWIIRWGINIIAGIFIVIIIGCCLIKYPRLVEAPIIITTLNPPSDLAARHMGLIDTVYVSNGKRIKKGDLIMVLATPARFQDVTLIEDSLRVLSNINKFLEQSWLTDGYALGDLQNTWAEFVTMCIDYKQYLEIEYLGKKQSLLQIQVLKNKAYFTKLQIQQQLLEQDLRFEQINFDRDSVLYAKSVISAADYELSARNLISKRNSKAGFDATLTSTELNIIQIQQQITELSIQRQKEIYEYERKIWLMRQQLLAQISQWKEQYVIQSPADGTVSLMSFWSKNQKVNMGDILASIVPNSKIEVIGRMKVPSNGFGRVEVGQFVNVKLNGFPYMEYGVLRGYICSISPVPEQSSTTNGTIITYTAEVMFADKLQTSYNIELPMVQQMNGTAEIITKEMRLIEQFIQPIVSLFKNQ